MVELEPRIVAAGQVDSEGMLQGIVSDLSGSSHHPTTKEIRAWCRRTFGPSWWDVEPSVKKERKREAKAALLLQGGLSENRDDVATGSAQPSQKEIRAWCRQEFGSDWWQVGTDVKATRKSQAVKALRVGASPAPLPESTG